MNRFNLLSSAQRKPGLSIIKRTLSSAPDHQKRGWRSPEKAFPASHYERLAVKNAVQCNLCPRHCKILPQKFGFCGVRGNKDGHLVTYNFGRSVQAALETIETEAVYHYQPGASILSLGNIGCMMSCTFCHNWQTSQVKHLSDKSVHYYTPEEVVENALENNIGILSWTYNDPVVWHEFVCKTAELGQKHGIKSLYKSAFYIEKDPIDELIDVIDIFSLSLKSMDSVFYKKVTKGRLEPVLRGIEQVHKSGRHLEVSQLLVTDMNDTEEQCRKTANWMATTLSVDVPLHFVRFHPAFEYTHVDRTPLNRLYRARDIAHEEKVKHVYVGNVYQAGCADTKCSDCGNVLVKRFGLSTKVVGIDAKSNTCNKCGAASPIVDAFGGSRFTLPENTESPDGVLKGTFSLAPEQLVSQEVSWSAEVNSVHVVFPNVKLPEERNETKLVLVREPHNTASVVNKPLGRVILSRASESETGIRVFSDQKFQLFSVLDRAHFPVFANEKDGEGPSKALKTGIPSSSSSTRSIRTRPGSARGHSTRAAEPEEYKQTERKSISTALVRSKPNFSSAKPIGSPIFQTSAFESGDPYFYTRASNPNFEDVESLFTQMDAAEDSVLLSSGMATIAAVLSGLQPGQNLIANKLLYGCSVRFLIDYCKANSINLRFVDLTSKEIRKTTFANTSPDVVFFETPTNPFLCTVSISDVVADSKAYNENCFVVVDNTWATPVFQQPLEQGADAAVYSCSKFFSGHSDTILGVASTRRKEDAEIFRKQRFYSGAVPDPFAAWLLRRSLQTLNVRMKAHVENTARVMEFLTSGFCRPYVEQVFFPEIDGEQMSDYGGLLFFKMKNDKDGVRSERFASVLNLFDRGTSMATVRSAVAIPYSGSHASMNDREKADIGLGKDIVRLSVGIEEAKDLVEDMKQGFKSS